MESLYLLIPLSLLLVFAIAWVFWWAISHKQFDELEHQGRQIIEDKDV